MKQLGLAVPFSYRQPQVLIGIYTRHGCDRPLPRYYFHLIAETRFLDDEGTSFESDQAAMQHARQLAAELVKNLGLVKGVVVVENEDDGGLFEIPLSSWNN